MLQFLNGASAEQLSHAASHHTLDDFIEDIHGNYVPKPEDFPYLVHHGELEGSEDDGDDFEVLTRTGSKPPMEESLGLMELRKDDPSTASLDSRDSR